MIRILKSGLYIRLFLCFLLEIFEYIKNHEDCITDSVYYLKIKEKTSKAGVEEKAAVEVI